MTDIVRQLWDLYATHPLVMESVDEIERLRELIHVMLENDPNDMAGDGTVLDVWRKEARRALGIAQAQPESTPKLGLE
jgi:hypothetical protein